MSIRRLWLSWVGARLLIWKQRRITPQDLQRSDFPTSTQTLGLRFTRKLRDTFRFRWLKPR